MTQVSFFAVLAWPKARLVAKTHVVPAATRTMLNLSHLVGDGGRRPDSNRRHGLGQLGVDHQARLQSIEVSIEV